MSALWGPANLSPAPRARSRVEFFLAPIERTMIMATVANLVVRTLIDG